ncbi:Ecdysteroid kinase-like family [Popillia japonica]|uniref:Ecdysteroid kinase-like family n=1 Tax=Popillia japonica TaxID=7064 RepID=A0AAW1IAQ4_POPJA
MEAYGKFHAISFALRDQEPELLRKLAENTVEQVFNRRDIPVERSKQHMSMQHKKILDCLNGDEDAAAIEKYKKYIEDDVDIMRGVFDNVNEYCVIGHGDSWVNNMLFKYENASHPDRPTKVSLLDWQLSRYGSPALDLSYFIFTCTDHALRAKHYDNMIKFYYH